jgi:hypothetical protein
MLKDEIKNNNNNKKKTHVNYLSNHGPNNVSKTTLLK